MLFYFSDSLLKKNLIDNKLWFACEWLLVQQLQYVNFVNPYAYKWRLIIPQVKVERFTIN